MIKRWFQIYEFNTWCFTEKTRHKTSPKILRALNEINVLSHTEQHKAIIYEIYFKYWYYHHVLLLFFLYVISDWEYGLIHT